MTREQIEYLIELYGFEHLLGGLQEWQVLDILNDDAYINLESYYEPE
jgi:hypothetical protein